jgi:hypothetical protein
MTDKICNVFISHVHEDDHRLEPLKDLLAKNGCQVRDSSVSSSNPNRAKDPDYIMRDILQPRIDWAGTVIVLVTPDTKDSEWVNREIDYAREQGKRIVGVWDDGEKGCDLPEKLDDYADDVVAWRADQIIDAIFAKINDWRGPKGDPVPERNIARYRC